MKKLVVTLCIGPEFEAMSQVSHSTLQRYANRIGAEFKVISEQKLSKSTAHWDKFQLFDLFDEFDRILYVDTDCLIRQDCPDLFEMVPFEQMGLFNEGAFAERGYALSRARDEYAQFLNVNLNDWDGKYYNTGVMVLSRAHKFIFKKPEIEVQHFYEQSYLNLLFHLNRDKIFQLPYQFNRMSILDGVTGRPRHDSYIVHYAGGPREVVTPLMAKDLQRWKEDYPKFSYRQHILFQVTGGMGDQLCAEPTIRYAINNVWRGEDVRIATHFPQFFKHLGVPVYQHGQVQLQPDTPYHIRVPHPDVSQPLWAFLSNLMCHTIDFCAISALRRTLPDSDKQIRLTVSEDALASVASLCARNGVKAEKLILVHAGKHWESKTFPVSWWQAVIDRLTASSDQQVCLIGKSDGDRGYVDVDLPKGSVSIDLRDRLSLDELIALISLAPVLISNDSAPIHIAGAFENQIILIPTCKHPDHILPWRRGSKTWRAQALYDRLVLDDSPSAPNIMEEILVDKWVGTAGDYLPDTQTVADAAVKAHFVMEQKRLDAAPKYPEYKEVCTVQNEG